MSQTETIRSMFDDAGSVETYPYAVELAGLEGSGRGPARRSRSGLPDQYGQTEQHRSQDDRQSFSGASRRELIVQRHLDSPAAFVHRRADGRAPLV